MELMVLLVEVHQVVQAWLETPAEVKASRVLPSTVSKMSVAVVVGLEHQPPMQTEEMESNQVSQAL
jgi:hypothetical protein